MSAPGSAAGERRMVASKIFQLGQFVSDTVAERAQLAVIDVDPRARLQIQRPQRQLLVDTPLTADAVADSLVRAGLRVQSWAAEVPVHDGFARLSLRSRTEMPRWACGGLCQDQAEAQPSSPSASLNRSTSPGA